MTIMISGRPQKQFKTFGFLPLEVGLHTKATTTRFYLSLFEWRTEKIYSSEGIVQWLIGGIFHDHLYVHGYM